jgi:choline dehydrogenase-like flavoprotein
VTTEVCDYLIIGGGSAGCIVAKRLSERTSGRIILLEAGKSDEGDPAANDLYRLDELEPSCDWEFRASTTPGSPAALTYSRARMLGGCGNHNDCAFLRPPDSDFDQWELTGATGWGAREMQRYYARVAETVAVEPPPQHPLSRAFVSAGLETGLRHVDFAHEIASGVGWFPLNARGRLRQSSSVAYLHPLASLPRHFEIRTGTCVTGLTVAEGRATGAVTSRGTIAANRAVILAGGAIQTPQLLMLSGIGPAEELRRHDIPVIVENSHVGQHLRDHVAAPVVWATRQPVAPWEVCPFEATMMLQLDSSAPAPDVLFHFGLRVREKYGDDPRLRINVPAVKASPNVTRARSEGSVTLSGCRFEEPPVIQLNYLSDPYDLETLLKAMKFTRRLLDTESLGSVCSRELHPGPLVNSDEELAAYVRNTCETVYHPCGTAAIGHVVTPELKLIGLDCLYVVDASVFPSLITVNINCAVMMVAEKAADHILSGT